MKTCQKKFRVVAGRARADCPPAWGGDLPLDRSLELFELGVRLSRECQKRLDEAERKVEILLRGNDGGYKPAPFEAGRGMTAPESITDYLATRAAEVNEWLDRFVPSRQHRPSSFIGPCATACSPAVSDSDRRLAAGEAFGADTDDLMPAACANRNDSHLLVDSWRSPGDGQRRFETRAANLPQGVRRSGGDTCRDALLTRAFRVLAATHRGARGASDSGYP